MVRLSPKALRFAEDAARDLSVGARQSWETWSADRQSRPLRPALAPEGYVDVPEHVAEVLFSAVERRIERMEQSLDRDDDPDLGNDIAFLRAVSGTLQAGLRQTSEAEL